MPRRDDLQGKLVTCLRQSPRKRALLFPAPASFEGLTVARGGAYAATSIERSRVMRSLVVFVVLMLAALAAPAQRVVKCTHADGSVAYQQSSCDSSASSEALDVKPVPQINSNEKRFVQTHDPYTGQVNGNAWIDVPGTSGGPTYTTREFRQVNDPYTGQVRNAWVDVEKPVPEYRPQTVRRTPPMPARAQAPQPSYYQPSDKERRRNSAYENNRCRMLTNAAGC